MTSACAARPRVSVLVPAFNAGPFIAVSLSSALAQDAASLEVIVVDDGSTDRTGAVVENIAARDARVRLIRSAANRGPGSARNLGLAAARGAWIAPLDADDAFEPGRLGGLLALGERHGADMVCDNLLLCPDGDGEPCRPMLARDRLPHPKRLTPAAFVNGTCGSRREPRVSTGFLKPLIRREFIERNRLRYDEGSRFGEDFLFYLACVMAGARWWITPEAMYRYAVRAGSLTEVQSAADLWRIGAAEAALLRAHPMVAADPALRRALRRHKEIIDRFYYYRAFMDPVKQGAFLPAARVLMGSPNGFRHVMAETAYQAPRIAAKALRGGYGRGMF